MSRVVMRRRRPEMKRVLCGLVLLITASIDGVMVSGQSAGFNDPAFLKRNFSPITYIKASNPRIDAKLGFGSALTGRTLVLSRDGNTLAVSAPDESSAATGINGNQKDDSASGAGGVILLVA